MSDDGLNQNLGGQWRQLPMFMTGREIMRTTTPGDAGISRKQTKQAAQVDRKSLPVLRSHYNTIGSMWKQKLVESEQWGYRDSIRQQGVKQPVSIQEGHWHDPGKDNLYNGHHRVITAAVDNPKSLVPVDWLDDERRDPSRYRTGKS